MPSAPRHSHSTSYVLAYHIHLAKEAVGAIFTTCALPASALCDSLLTDPHLNAMFFCGVGGGRRLCRRNWCRSSDKRDAQGGAEGVLTWGNVGVVLVLREAAGARRRICVANTHLVFNQKRGEIKLAQAAILVHAVADLIVECAGPDGAGSVAIVLGGDLNSTPRSKIAEFLTRGSASDAAIGCSLALI